MNLLINKAIFDNYVFRKIIKKKNLPLDDNELFFEHLIIQY